MRKLIYISLIVFAGCETSLTPQTPDGMTGSSISDYFWPDSAVAYSYQSSTGDNQTVYISIGGSALDIDQNATIPPTPFAISRVNGSDILAGFSPTDIFGLDSGLQVVMDTSLAPLSWIEPIRTIATAALGGGFNPPAMLYAASDSVLYAVDPNKLMLNRLVSFPKNFTLVESPQGDALFAYQMGGDSIMWTTDETCVKWSGVKPPANITAFASATPNFSFDIGWFACGNNVYRITFGSAPQKITTLPSKVITMIGENNGVVAGLDNGFIYDVNRDGLSQQRQAVAPGLIGISLVTASNTNPILAGTSSGVFAIPNFGPAMQIDNGAVSTIFSTGSSLFADMGSDSVFHYNANGTRYGGYPNPPAGYVTQFARPTSGVPNASQGIFALSGTSVFRRDSVGVATWIPLNQMISAPPTIPRPGSLTLLDSNSAWFAGFVERNMGGGQPPHGYAYYATSSGPSKTATVGGVTYNNVILVNYTAEAHGVTDITDVPQYNIYFEKGVGPVVIEKIENGKTVTTTYVK